MLRIGIIGLGPWGLCALERIITTARGGLTPGLTLEIHTVDPGTPGSGVYDLDQPDYLLLNNPCSQLSLYPFANGDTPRYGVGLYEWAVARGYRWLGERCVLDPAGAPIEPHHFLPRRVMGEYLAWFYQTLAEEAPPSVRVIHHATSAVDVIPRFDNTELVCLADGGWLMVDQVIITSGHTSNEDPHEVVPQMRQLSAYPVGRYVDSLPAGVEVGVAGIGLVAVDVVTARRSAEVVATPRMAAVCAISRAAASPSCTCTHAAALPSRPSPSPESTEPASTSRSSAPPRPSSSLTGGTNGSRRQVDVRTELLPLMFAEMYARYYAQAAFQCDGLQDSIAVRTGLSDAWTNSRFEQELSRLGARYGPFDAAELFFGPQKTYSNSSDYEAGVYRMFEEDLREAEVPEGNSPVKSAAEVFRIFRDPMRSVVEQGGLSMDSYLDFNADIFTRITRLVAGPPALRTRQFLALMDAGLLRIPFGPAPAIGPGHGEGALGNGPARIRSTLLDHPHSADVALPIRGHLEEPRVDGSASQLLNRLYGEGRLSEFRYGSVTVGSVDLTPDSHPIDLSGRPQERIWMFGVLTEGIRHFTHYLPSPKSRIRAFEEIGRCVGEILQAEP